VLARTKSSSVIEVFSCDNAGAATNLTVNVLTGATVTVAN